MVGIGKNSSLALPSPPPPPPQQPHPSSSLLCESFPLPHSTQFLSTVAPPHFPIWLWLVFESRCLFSPYFSSSTARPPSTSVWLFSPLPSCLHPLLPATFQYGVLHLLFSFFFTPPHSQLPSACLFKHKLIDVQLNNQLKVYSCFTVKLNEMNCECCFISRVL